MKPSVKDRGIAALLRWGGALLARAGHAAFASQLFRAGESLVPADMPPFAYARALWQDHQYAEAKCTLIRILAIAAEHAEANNLLGVLFFEENQIELAGQHFRRAIDARPNFAAPRNNLGNIHRANDEPEEAARCYRAALECDPCYVEALTNLGVTLNAQENNVEAEGYCRKAIELAPEFAGAHCNLGNVLLSLGRGGEAIAAYREALRLEPGLAEALVNIALVLEDSRYLIGTIDYYERQLRRQPNNHLPHVRIAQALQALDRWDEARQSLDRALKLKSEATDALLLLGINYAHIGDVRAGIECLRRVLSGGPNAMAEGGIAFDSLYIDDCTGEQLCAKYRDWAECHIVRQLMDPPTLNIASAERRLRIGYVSRDFTQHSVAFFLEPILKHHDHSCVEVFCYSTLIKGDDFTDRFRALADTWRDISTLPEEKAAELVREDAIDILVDLSGHTAGNRLGVFAGKPAPVQVTYLGHPTTTGLAAIDYRFGDAVADPAELTAGHYVERLWQLPGCFLSYQPSADAPPVAQPPLLSKKHVTFGSFNNAAKINDTVIAVWAEILTAVPSSRLLLKSLSFSSSHGRARLVDGFSRHRISPDRLELVDWRAGIQNHLELYGEVDIALDPFPYNGTTTSCEALWMGLPVICLEGHRHSARVGASLLTVLDLGDLLARDRAEYVRIATELAGEPLRLRALRESMRDRMRASALLDHAEYTRGLEQAYREMWRTYCLRRVGSEGRSDSDREVLHAGERAVSLALAGVATIRVPDSLDVMTRYVVEERGDWFEDEIRFVRKMLLPGQLVVDVGANYGVYTLSMAASVGSSGKVFSFEPSPSTTRWLRESVEFNGFDQVEILERAVSDKAGRGFFKIEANAELSRLLDADESTALDIGVDITTLDLCREELHWGKLNFIKIDAEGQEPHVVRGARKLLDEDSPLVMAEYKHGQQLNHAVLDEFGKLGFHTYRLVPGLLLLMPVADITDVDPYLLNLFFCRDDTAEALCARGMLVPRGFNSSLAFRNRTHFGQGRDRRICEERTDALKLYSRAREESLAPGERLFALTESLAAAEKTLIENPTLAGKLTLARVRADFGLRNEARVLFMQILDDLKQNGGELTNEPFLAPAKRVEPDECEARSKNWLIAAVAEWLASNTGFSSFFTADESLRFLQIARRAEADSAEVQRHIDLILRRKRFGADHENEKLRSLPN